MKLVLLSTFVGSAMGFHVSRPVVQRVAPLFETPASIAVGPTLAKSELMETAQNLNYEYGVLLIDSKAQEQLKDAVEKLEMTSETTSDTSGLIGEWTLLCSTASASLEKGPLDKIGGIDTSKLPFFNDGPLKDIRDRLNKSIQVQQLIKAEKSSNIDRIDHVIDYKPPDTLSEFLDNLPDAIKSLNINPLQVSESKVVLKHKAQVESVTPVIKTKLSLESIVLNVAGKSQVLEPGGADVLGINVPFGEFLNAGSFETTYLDEDIRISRSKVGIVEQLRVFVREKEEAVVDEDDTGAVDEDDVLDGEDIAPSDVEGEE